MKKIGAHQLHQIIDIEFLAKQYLYLWYSFFFFLPSNRSHCYIITNILNQQLKMKRLKFMKIAL